MRLFAVPLSRVDSITITSGFLPYMCKGRNSAAGGAIPRALSGWTADVRHHLARNGTAYPK
jgi:hypothetical protein